MSAEMSFGSWLKRRRQSLDLTQKELAAKIGCSVFAVRKIEGEERRPSRQLTTLLADALKIPEGERALFLKVARGEREVEKLSVYASSYPRMDEIRVQGSRPTLPIPVTFLVGREMELDEIARMLREPDCRLLTLVGGGGIGKTRLGLEVARRFARGSGELADFKDGVCFIPFAHLTAFEQVPGAIAEGTGFSFSGKADDRTQLLSFLQDKQALIILDSLEHLLYHSRSEFSQFISDLLRRSPGIKVLATSRESINMQEEWGFEVSGLPYPSPAWLLPSTSQRDANEALQGLEEFSAVKLFLQTVRRKDSRFRLTTVNYRAVLRICHLVNGMPLGIELAAGWTSTLTCDEIAQEIANNLDFLSTTAQNAPERHRSIRAALDHSWKLLSEAERKVLSILSIFQGGFRRDAAVFVAGATLPVIHNLIDKSLIYRSQPGRYDMHDLVRQYAREQLNKKPDVNKEALSRHSHFYFDFLESRFPALRNHKQKEALIALTIEIDNLRLAWETAVKTRQVDELRRVTHPLMTYYELRNLFQEGETVFQQALAMAQDLPAGAELDVALADIMAQRAWFGFRSGRMRASLALLNESMALLRKNNASEMLAEVLWYHAFACWFSGSFRDGLRSTQEGIALNEAAGGQWQLAIIRLIRGGILHDMGAFEEADVQLQTALALCRLTGDPRTISVSISMICRNRQAMNQFDGMREILQEGLRLSIETEDRYGMGMALEHMGLAAQAAGDFQEAQERFANCIQLFGEIGDLWSLSRSYNSIGKYYLTTGDIEAAARSFFQAFQTAVTGRVMNYAVEALVHLAFLEQQFGSPVTAYRYATFILENENCSDGVRERTEKLLQELKNQMREDQLDQAVSNPISAAPLSDVLITNPGSYFASHSDSEIAQSARRFN